LVAVFRNRALVSGAMFRFVRNFLLILLLAAAVAAGVLFLRSSDPLYTAQELLYHARFRRYDSLIVAVSRKHGLDPMLIKAIIWRESSFDANKVGRNGERGLMQVTEGAAKDWAISNKMETFVPTDLFAPKTNIEAGTWYLKQAMQRYTGKDDPVTFALAEYNAGRGRMNKWIGDTNMGQRATAGDLRDSISIPSTRTYVETILARYRFYKERGRL
jgi:soluble lytic murein transglycosylase